MIFYYGVGPNSSRILSDARLNHYKGLIGKILTNEIKYPMKCIDLIQSNINVQFYRKISLAIKVI
ncbi:MAG: hypothetical protein WBA54_07500 [Acidaminobacteraceae bacterium]